MQTAKIIFNFFEWFFGAFWFITTFDYLGVSNTLELEALEFINSSVQSLYVAVGLVYFIAAGIYRHNLKQEEIIAKRIANKKSQLELENLEQRRKKN